MKLGYILLVNLAFLPISDAATPVAIETFKNIADPVERRKIIIQAPIEQQRELNTIDHHLRLLKRWNSEAGLKTLRESLSARKRGLGALMDLIPVELHVLDLNIGSKMHADKVNGILHDQAEKSLVEMVEQRTLIEKRQSTIHDLVFKLAASPPAFALNERAQVILTKLYSWLSDSAIHFPLTPVQRDSLDTEIDSVLKELVNLPILTPEQIQKEYDASSEDRIDLGTRLD